MIVGSGLIASAFSSIYKDDMHIIIYAAGVSNSNCIDEDEFKRERIRLSQSINNLSKDRTFVYFGTCSVEDPVANKLPYVQHKLAMEKIVSSHPNYLIIRLPQVAGATPNPHTLLNFLYTRISSGEKFNLWMNAKRNIIDVDDIVSIAFQLIDDLTIRNTTINIANKVNYKMMDIVQTMEHVLQKTAIYDPIDSGSEYNIDINKIYSVLKKTKIKFGEDYLKNVIEKYYTKPFRVLSE